MPVAFRGSYPDGYLPGFVPISFDWLLRVISSAKTSSETHITMYLSTTRPLTRCERRSERVKCTIDNIRL